MVPEKSVRPEELLAHAGWMRALAGALLADPDAADDVVQQAWIAAWRRPPATDQPLEPWLARVVRNFASKRRRGEDRRSQHEARAPSTDPDASPGRTLEQLELQRELVDAVAQLDEPLRTTLVLRWFEGRTSVEIARLQGAPEGTVRWRLKRGLDELRQRLDKRFGGRDAWGVAFAPFAAPWDASTAAPDGAAAVSSSSAAPAATGVVLVGATMKFAAAALVVCAASLWWMSEEPANGGAAVGPRVGAERAPSVTALVDAPAQAQRAELDTSLERFDANAEAAQTPATDAGASVAPVEVPPGTIQARFVDAVGVPWAGVQVECEVNDALITARSDSDGRVSLEVQLGSPADQRTALLDAHRRGLGSVRIVSSVRSGGATHLGDIVLVPGAELRGRVVDARGEPVASARVGLLPAAFELGDPAGVRRRGDDEFDSHPDVWSDADGRFRFEGVAAGSWRVWAHADELRYAWSDVFESAPSLTLELPEIVLTDFEASDRIAGRVLGPQGEPIAGINVRVGYTAPSIQGSFSVLTGADGRFELIVESEAVYRFIALCPERKFGAAHAEGVTPGTLDLVLELSPPSWIALDVKAANGTRPQGVSVELIDAQHLNVAGSDSRWYAPEDGRVSLAAPDFRFQLTVSAPDFQPVWLGPFEPRGAPATLEVVLQPLPRLRGIVLSAHGPIAGAVVQPLCSCEEGKLELDGFLVRMMRCGFNAARSVADGSFVVEGSGEVWLRVSADGFAPALVGPLRVGASGEPVQIELGRGGAIEGRVLRADGGVGEGAIVGLSCGDGFGFTLRAGPDGAFRAEGLTPGSWQVLSRSAEQSLESSTLRELSGAAPIEWSCRVREGEVTRFDLQLE